MCGAGHAFMSRTVEDRSKVLFKNKLCYGCYGCISKDYSARNCKQQRSCKICKEKHPTGLYGFKPKKEGLNKTEEMVTIADHNHMHRCSTAELCFHEI